MAIEKQNNQPEVQLEGTEDMTVALEAIEESGEQDFEIQEDGSAVLVGAEEPVALGFDSNLAEALDVGLPLLCWRSTWIEEINNGNA